MTKLTTKSPAYIAAKKVLDNNVRKLFDSVADAVAAAKAIYALDGFPSDFPIVAARLGAIDVTGDDSVPPLADWPEAYSAEGVRVALAFVGARNLPDPDAADPAKAKSLNGSHGFAIYPLFGLEAIAEAEGGTEWLWKVVEKESSHVAFRKLRGLPDGAGVEMLAAAAQEMPISIADYVEDARGEATDTEAFDSVWAQFKKVLGAQSGTALLARILPAKAEVIRAIRSTAFAKGNYPELESMGAFTFVGQNIALYLDKMLQAATDAGEDTSEMMDGSEIKAWLAGRDERPWTPRAAEVVDVSAIKLGDFTL